MNYYVYALIDPRNNLPFYIGKGSGKRIKHHFQKREKGRNRFKDNVVAKIYAEGLEPIVVKLRENLGEDESLRIEDELIIQYGRRGVEPNGILTNICLHNQPPKSPWTEERKQKLRDSLKKYKRTPEHIKHLADANRGKKLSEEHKIKLSLATKGRPKTKEHCQKISAGLKGIKRSPEHTRKLDECRRARRGTHLSEETKQKIRESLRRWRETQRG